MTVDAVNEALAGRNESDVPLDDPYWAILNAYRLEISRDSTRPEEPTKPEEDTEKLRELDKEYIRKPVVPEILPDILNQLDPLEFLKSRVPRIVVPKVDPKVEPAIELPKAEQPTSNDKGLDDFLKTL